MARKRPVTKLFFPALAAFGLGALQYGNVMTPQTRVPVPAGPPQPPSVVAPVGQNNQLSALDELLIMLSEGRRNYREAVRDYCGTLTLREKTRDRLRDEKNQSFEDYQAGMHDRTKPKLREESVIDFTCRANPFSVYMKWRQPQKFVGKEVCYAEGKNRGMARMKENVTFLHFLGFGNFRISDPVLLESGRHRVVDLGIGNLIDYSLKIVLNEQRVPNTAVRVTEEFFDNRPCLRVELIRGEPRPGLDCCRTVLFLEKVTKMPVRMETYEWPTTSGAAGELLDLCSYTDLRFNQDLKSETFNK